jgi:hypothetical protein
VWPPMGTGNDVTGLLRALAWAFSAFAPGRTRASSCCRPFRDYAPSSSTASVRWCGESRVGLRDLAQGYLCLDDCQAEAELMGGSR